MDNTVQVAISFESAEALDAWVLEYLRKTGAQNVEAYGECLLEALLASAGYDPDSDGYWQRDSVQEAEAVDMSSFAWFDEHTISDFERVAYQAHYGAQTAEAGFDLRRKVEEDLIAYVEVQLEALYQKALELIDTEGMDPEDLDAFHENLHSVNKA